MIEINDLVYLLVNDYEESHGLFRDKQGVVQELYIDTDRALVDFGSTMAELPLAHIKISSENKVSLPDEPTTWNPEEANVSSTGSLRFNTNKPPIHLVPTLAIKALAEVLDYGSKKYAERNWEKGNNYSVPYSSMMRHVLAFWDGEDTDPESGLPHTYHILMNAAMLLEYSEKFKNLDDRPYTYLKGEQDGSN